VYDYRIYIGKSGFVENKILVDGDEHNPELLKSTVRRIYNLKLGERRGRDGKGTKYLYL
jgi:hypothetical protein